MYSGLAQARSPMYRPLLSGCHLREAPIQCDEMTVEDQISGVDLKHILTLAKTGTSVPVVSLLVNFSDLYDLSYRWIPRYHVLTAPSRRPLKVL